MYSFDIITHLCSFVNIFIRFVMEILYNQEKGVYCIRRNQSRCCNPSRPRREGALPRDRQRAGRNWTHPSQRHGARAKKAHPGNLFLAGRGIGHPAQRADEAYRGGHSVVSRAKTGLPVINSTKDCLYLRRQSFWIAYLHIFA